jgi:hypothetical protein
MRYPSDQLLESIDKAKRLIFEHFQINIEADISVCTIDEMINRLNQIYSPKALPIFEKIKPLIHYLDGKYFREEQEIWLIEERGENLPTIMHEMLHSIQKCDADHREPIVHYLTFKLTGDKTGIYNTLIEDWREIERIYGLNQIKERLISEGDCEDF